MVLYDGAPDHPGPDRLWAFVERHAVEVLGVSPTLDRALMTHGDEPVRAHDLSSLRILGSTGEPWNPDPWWWLFRTVGNERIPIVNYSGGTEISGGILCGNPLLPLKPCSFPAPCPGIAADVVDEDGEPVPEGVGELVIREPWIGMARGFWNDRERYLETYWSRFPGLWVHGDWARVDEDGFWYVLGRSDDTLNVAGKRVGPAEVESVLVGHPAVMEAVVVGVDHEVKGTALVGLCRLRDSRAAGPDGPDLDASASADARHGGAGAADGRTADPRPDHALARELRERVADAMGRPFRPDRILFVPDLPRTRNGKLMRRVARAACTGADPGDLSALVNPEAVEAIREAAG